MKKLTSAEMLLVFLVEPSAMQAKIIAAELGKVGVHAIEYFDDAASALAAMRADRPGLVLSSMYLPDMSGVDLIHAMRRDRTMDDIAFILVSSETRPQVLESVRQSGACGILPKPFTRAQLETAMAATLDYLACDDPLDDHDVDLEDLVVLIVDDSPNSRHYVRRVMENLGIKHFIEAENGVQAVDILSESLVDLVVTDFNMPEMDGMALIEHIRSKSWQNSVPILMVTSEQDKSRLAGIENFGVSGVCDKPFAPGVIRTLLSKVLANRNTP